MKITVVGRQMNVYDEMKDLIERKLGKLDKYFSGEGDATVTLSCKHNEKNLEITISAANTLFRSEVGADSFRTALDEAVDAIERQIRRNKTRVARRLRTGGLEVIQEETFGSEESAVKCNCGSTRGGNPRRLRKRRGHRSERGAGTAEVRAPD